MKSALHSTHSAKLTAGVLALTCLLLALAVPIRAAGTVYEKSLTFRLTSTVASGRFVDRPPKGRTSRGDMTYVWSVLRNSVSQFGRPKGAVVGRDYAVSTLLSARTALAKVSVRLPGGTLRLRGKVDITRTSGILSVVGGTGAFAGARGTCSVSDREDRSINIYRITL